MIEPEAQDWQECWVVLDARNGREQARLPLDSAASGSHHLSHPDGIHMGLCIGMGQDGILLHWARWDGEKLTSWDLNETMDRILVDTHTGLPGFLTVEHYGADLQLHALDGTVLAEEAPEPPDGEDPPCWDYGCGFVDSRHRHRLDGRFRRGPGSGPPLAARCPHPEDTRDGRVPEWPRRQPRSPARRWDLAHLRRQQRDAQSLE